jgi:cytochrome P450
MFANLDVTTGALSWLLVNLASHPASQSHLYNELLTALGNAEAMDTEALDTYINASGTYLSFCVSESARVRPIAAFSVPQAAPTTRVVGGYRIPAGTSITVDSYALNIRNPFWGKDGASFRPERWAELKPSETRYNAWRFGFGPRNCMGKHLAEKMLRVALVQLLRDYELNIESEEGRGGGDDNGGGSFSVNLDSWITHPDVRISCRPRHFSSL